ncbi:MAG TPA: MATE family efflux transporter [Tissierellaceae bacterium]|nr:MATE family efflux transporter [Tissierellaceae bacterium]
MSEDSHSKKSVRQEINRITGPVFIELLLGTLFGMVDMMMLGNYGDPASQAAAIAAVGVTNQYMFIGLALIQSLNTGATAMVARYLGARHEDKIESVVKHIMILTQVIIVAPFILIGLGFTIPVMRFMGAHSDTIAIGSNYFRVIMVGFIFQAYNFSIVASLRGAGDTRTPMGINVTANLLNVFGNAVLIYGLFGFPELGATGAAISTAASHVFAGALLTRYILKKDSTIHINFRHKFTFNKDIIYNLTKIGIPASLEQIAMRAGILIFSRIIASLGTVAYATHQIAVNILSLSFTPGQAFGISASTLTGRSLGEENSDLAEKYIKGCSNLGAIIAFIMGIGFYFLGGQIAGLYTDNQEVIREAASVLKLIAFIQPFQTSQLIIAGGLRGAGDTVWTLISTFIGILVIRVALAYYFVMVLGIGLMGAWIAIFIDQFMRWIMINLRFRTDKWKYITIR